MDVQQIVNALEIPQRIPDALIPDLAILFVAGLELYQFLAAGFTNLRITGRSLVCLLVNAHDLGDRSALQSLRSQQVFPTVDDHSELRAPVADGICATEFVSNKPPTAPK